jgi:hypothetical protein
LESHIPVILGMFVKFLSNITTPRVLQGKPPVPGPNNTAGLTVSGRKLETYLKFCFLY